MARIRTIKPEFWTDEDMAEVSEPACLLAIGLLNYADDEGYFNANPKLI
ncbi:TPA: DnaT-like ssDNA-binding domain-containing protein, partial [Klebsiella pneumoniae]|nr:primosomal protein [Klebsiella pneumoniae]HBS0757583.1 primosomal protein [Klebsiella pneumoniae]HBS4205217.1 primosomal protein [Klebsiella pneumoniae]HCA7210188.1 primosomal protein [Klebsiella pneumoniae]HCA7491790.1 primosomal protein [Klebsiella pneumoniae]